MTDEDMKAELERLKAENERLKSQRGRSVSLKVSEKGGVSVYGLGRFPVTLYKEQWTKLLAMADELRAFWREMSRRKLMVLVHPTYPCDGPLNDAGSFIAVGYPGETALAATRLALSGVLEECPDVRIVWSHLGGGLAMIMDRLDRGYQRFSTCPHPPSYYLRRCYFDTACTHGPALDCAHATFGAGALLFGTDVPHVPNSEKETIIALKSRSWSANELASVFAGNIKNLLRE